MAYVNIVYRLRAFLLLHLAADIGADLVGSRVYALLMPQNVVFPAIVITHLGTEEIDNLNERGRLHRSLVQIDCYDDEYSVSSIVADGINKVTRRLADASYGTSPQQIIKMIHDDKQEFLEEAEEVKEFRVMQRYAVWHYEN